MKESVIIKSSRYGIHLILQPDLSFGELLSDIAQKFSDAGKFFGEAEMAISFEGRVLSDEEQEQIVDCIMKHSAIRILFIVDYNELQDEMLKRRIELQKRQEQVDAQQEELNERKIERTFYRGSLAEGEQIETEDSIIVMGDVPEGAGIVSKESIIVLGALRGKAFAGMDGDKEAFIAALSFAPQQYNIAGIFGTPVTNTQKSGLFKRNKAPKAMIAKQDGGFITVTSLEEGLDGIL